MIILDAATRADLVQRLHVADCHDHPLSEHTEDVAYDLNARLDAVLGVLGDIAARGYALAIERLRDNTLWPAQYWTTARHTLADDLAKVAVDVLPHIGETQESADAELRAALAADIETVLNQQTGHSHTRPGIWDPDNRPGIANTACMECAARGRLRAWLDRQEIN